MTNLTPPRSPIADADGRVSREWLHLFSGMVSSIVAQNVSEMMALFPDPRSALAALEARVDALEAQQAAASTRPEIHQALGERIAALELQQAMRGDAAPTTRKPING